MKTKFWKIIIFSNLCLHILSQINFSGKMTILSYKTIFGPAFSVISENLVEPKKNIFWHIWTNLGRVRIFLKNRAKLFLPYLSPSFMPSFRKTVGAVSEINSLLTSIHTSGQGWYYRTSRFRWLNKIRLIMGSWSRWRWIHVGCKWVCQNIYPRLIVYD